MKNYLLETGRYSIQSLGKRRRMHFGHAAIVGGAAGGVAVLFQIALGHAFDIVTALLAWSRYHSIAFLVLPLTCAICGGLAGFLTKYYCPEAAGSGIPQVKGVLLHLGKIRWARVLAVKFVGGVMSIGSGFTLGREGPTIHIGAAVGSALTHLLRLPRRLHLHYIACGAGAGLAAAFNAPLAGFVFVLEELRRELSPLTYGTALIATVTADVVARLAIGARPSLFIPTPATDDLLSMRILPLALLIGAGAGIIGSAYCRLLLKSAVWSRRLDGRLSSIRPVLIGAIVGLVGALVPQSLGAGTLLIHDLLQTGQPVQASLTFLGLMFLLKFALNIACYSSGVPGGIFSPMLTHGALLGLCIGSLVQFLQPIAIPAAGVMGMAAYFAAVVQAPLTGVILIVEMTGNYNLLFALMAASMIAYFVAQALGSRPMYEALLESSLRTDAAQLESLNEPHIIEVVVEPHSAMDGRRLSDIPLPRGSLIITVRKGGTDMVPSGETILAAGDQIMVVISGEVAAAAAEVRKVARA